MSVIKDIDELRILIHAILATRTGGAGLAGREEFSGGGAHRTAPPSGLKFQICVRARKSAFSGDINR